MKATTEARPPIDWSAADAMTNEQRHAAAMADPDARPMIDEEWARAPRVARSWLLRRQLKLTQEGFAERFHIPLATLQDWEGGRAEPDATARAYLRVIAHDAAAVDRALAQQPTAAAAE